MLATARDARWRSAVTANYFEFFGLPLALGRPFTTEEARLGADSRVAIISHSFWEQRGADPNMVGRTVRVNGEPFTVIGVAAKGFTGTGIPGPEVWMPLGEQARARRARFDRRRTAPSGTSIETAAPTLATVARRLEQAYPAVNAGYTLQMSPPGASLVHAGSGKWRDDGDARRAPDDHAGHRPARRVPQPRRSAARAWPGAPAGTGDQVVARWRPMAPHSATAH